MFSRSVVIYGLIILAVIPLINRNKIKAAFSLRETKSAVESFPYLLELQETKEKVDVGKINQLIDYYQGVVAYFPERADGYSILGFCYFHEGNINEAIENFIKSIEINSDVIWFYYNLGQIYFHLGEYQKALQWFNQGIRTKPQRTLDFIASSKEIYWPIIGNNGNFMKLKPRLLRGYKETYQWAVMSLVKLNQYSEILSLSDRAIKLNFDDDGFFSFWASWAFYQDNQYDQSKKFLRVSLNKSHVLANLDYNEDFKQKALHDLFKENSAYAKELYKVFSLEKADVKLKLF